MPERDEAAFVQLKFRIREGLRAALEQAARQRGISMNAEITLRLEQSLDIDEARRELREREKYMLDSVAQMERHRAEAQTRANQLTDFLLQQWPNIRVQPKEEEQDK